MFWLRNKKNNKFVTLLRPMKISIKFGTVKSGCSIVYIERLQVLFLKYINFFSLKIDLSKQTVQTLMKCHLMQHFILVFAVFHSFRLGVSSPQEG